MNVRTTGLTLLVTTLLATPALAYSAQAETIKLHGKFVAEHDASTSPQGGIKATLDTEKKTFVYTIHYKGLSGPVTAVHLHGPADAGQDAGVMLPITGPYNGKLHGTLTLSDDQVTTVENGKSYVNLHTDKYGEGEARAQVVH